MGFSYKDWNGVFYPADMAARNYLGYYSRIFNAVEIDATFYGTPKVDTVQRWAAVTPEGFKFCVKVPRAITHDLALVGAWGLMTEFIGVMRGLGDKLGVILLQFPPSYTADQFPVLAEFLAELPNDLRFAVEVRDRSWYAAETDMEGMLATNGVAWAATEYPGLPGQVRPTAPFVYIRWIGQHGTFEHHTHERIDRSAELRRWWEHLQGILDGVEAVYGFFNNDYAGFAAGTANRFKSLVGLPLEEPKPPQQGRLF